MKNHFASLGAELLMFPTRVLGYSPRVNFVDA
jgi:hypothetical protein